MMDNKKNNEDFDLDTLFDDDPAVDNLVEESKADKILQPKPEAADPVMDEFDLKYDQPSEEAPAAPRKKRSYRDFEMDMDAMLLTAQSSMIIEGMKCYYNKDFSSNTLPVYIEAQKGVELYIKILDRNPNNYNKLKNVIITDIDCQEVEAIAFSLYKKIKGNNPDSNAEKLYAFEKFQALFREATNKAAISNSMKTLKKYFLISGGIDEVKILEGMRGGDIELKKDINNLEQHLNLALEMMKHGNVEITRGLRGKDVNIYIIKASGLLYYYYGHLGKTQIADNYYRIHDNYKKYFVIRD